MVTNWSHAKRIQELTGREPELAESQAEWKARRGPKICRARYIYYIKDGVRYIWKQGMWVEARYACISRLQAEVI